MFHFFIPLIPFSLLGALFFKRRILAYGLPVFLTLIQVVSTERSPVFFFTGAGLVLGVALTRKLKGFWKDSFWALVGYAGLAVLVYEIVSNFGVWFLAGCLHETAPLYPFTFVGLLQCYRSSLPYTALHFLKDVPLTVLVIKVLMLARWVDITRIPWRLKHESPR